MTKPFRFGVQAPGAYTASDWRRLARRIESLGYSSLLIPDHLDTQWGPLVAMAVAAEATTTLNVGTLVVANDYRKPVVLAKELATLDLIADGRVEFGIGAGWRDRDYRAAGLSFDKAAQRIDRLAESLTIMKRIWSDGAVCATGAHYSVDVAVGSPRPASRPHPPIMVGGGGKKILRLAAREADIVGINPSLSNRLDDGALQSILLQSFDDRVAWVKNVAADRWDSIELQCLVATCRVTAQRETSLAAYAKGSGMSPEEFGSSPMTLIGSVEEICDQLHQRRDRFRLNYWVIREQAACDFAPVVAALAGI